MGVSQKAGVMKTRIARTAIACAVVLLIAQACAPAQKAAWRQATETELKSVLPSRAGVERTHRDRDAHGLGNREWARALYCRSCVADGGIFELKENIRIT